MSNIQNKRIDMADWAKALAIFFVIISHTTISHTISDWLFMTEIPLFFFISGYLFRFDRNPSFRSFAKKRFRQIIVPYATISIVTYIFWLFIGRHYGADGTTNTPAWQPIIGTLLSDATMMPHDPPLYFFIILFNIEIIYYLTFKNKSLSERMLLTVLFAAVGAVDYYFDPIIIPFSISHSFVAIVFYSLGNELRNAIKINSLITANTAKGNIAKAIIAALLLVASIALLQLTGPTNLQKRIYSIYPLYFIETLSAIISIVLLCSIPKNMPYIISATSKETLYICGYHLLSFTFIKGFMVYILGMSLTILDGIIATNLFFAAASLALCLAAINATRRLSSIIKNKSLA